MSSPTHEQIMAAEALGERLKDWDKAYAAGKKEGFTAGLREAVRLMEQLHVLNGGTQLWHAARALRAVLEARKT